MRAVIYVRVSTKDQVKNLSLPTQRKACIEYCQRQNLLVDKVFVEEGESAKTADRTELKNLLAYCLKNKGRINTIVVYAVNRFARERHSHVVLRAQLSSLGITLRSATEPIDDSSTGKLIESMVSAIAEFDNDVRSERTVAGMKARLEGGSWAFRPPLGYIIGTGASGAKILMSDPQRAPLITKAFLMYATGLYTRRQVLDMVTHLGLTTRRGMPVSGQTFSQLLRQSLYAGVLEVPSWGVRQSSNAPSLVTSETFDKVQRLLDGKRCLMTPHQRNNPDFPLRHFVECGLCGRRLTGSWSKGRKGRRYAYYRCANRSCRGVNVRRDVMHRLFIDFLGQLQPRAEYLRLFGKIILDVWKQRQQQAAELHAAAVDRLTVRRERKQRLVEAFIYERVIDQSTYQDQLDKLNQEIALAEIEERDARIDQIDIESAVSFGEFMLLNAASLWVNLSLEQKQRFQQVLFPRGVRFAGGVYRTEQTSMIFSELAVVQPKKEDLVALTGIEPVFQP